jgi:hypothetical protein
VPAGVPGGPADLTETLRASVAAAKANRTRDAEEEAEPTPAAPKQRKPPGGRKKASA